MSCMHSSRLMGSRERTCISRVLAVGFLDDYLVNIDHQGHTICSSIAYVYHALLVITCMAYTLALSRTCVCHEGYSPQSSNITPPIIRSACNRTPSPSPMSVDSAFVLPTHHGETLSVNASLRCHTSITHGKHTQRVPPWSLDTPDGFPLKGVSG